jgi:hypothetical protein
MRTPADWVSDRSVETTKVQREREEEEVLATGKMS